MKYVYSPYDENKDVKIVVFPYRWDLYKYFFRGGKVGAEIGVAQGQNAADIWQFAKPKKLHLVDPWDFDDYVFAWGGTSKNLPQVSAREHYIFAQSIDSWKDYVEDVFRDEVSEGRVECHQELGLDWLKKQEDDSLDFVYCDARKDYGEIEGFLDECMRVLRPKGLFCGHDWYSTPQCRFLTYNVHRPLLDAIQDGKIRLLGLSTDAHLPPSFVCRVNK